MAQEDINANCCWELTESLERPRAASSVVTNRVCYCTLQAGNHGSLAESA